MKKSWKTGAIRDVVADVKYGTSKPAVEGVHVSQRRQDKARHLSEDYIK
jgi:hypothetical protein